MFCWVIANKDTGDIEHCYYDTGPCADEIRARLAQGELPIEPETMPANFFMTEITEEDLISAMADEKIGRFADDKNLLKMALLMDQDQKEFDAKRVREEFKVFQDKRRSAGIKVVARTVRAVIEETTGRIIENDVEFSQGVKL